MKHFIKLLPVLIALSSLGAAQAQTDLSQIKLQGRWPAGSDSILEGAALALSDKWVLSGADYADLSSADLSSANEGAVHVFSAITGAWVRMLRSPPALSNAQARFGVALAISGDLAIIGSWGDPITQLEKGLVYVFNLATGKLVRTITASDSYPNDHFGSAIAVSGNHLLIGSANQSNVKGAAYLFNLATGVQMHKFVSSDLVPSAMQYGYSLAIEGNTALIGAPGRASSRGAAYVVDLTTYATLSFIEPTGSAAGDRVGDSVALSQGIAVLAAPSHGLNKGAVFTQDLRTGAEHAIFGTAQEYLGWGDNHPGGVVATNGMILVGAGLSYQHKGSARLYDLHTALPIRTLFAPDASGGISRYGSAVAMCGNVALIARNQDSSTAGSDGAAYLIKGITAPMPVTKVAAKPDSAPGAVESTLSVLGDAFINADGEVAFQAKTAGFGSHSGTDTGVWSTMGDSGLSLGLSSISYSYFGEKQIASVGTPLINQNGTALYPATLRVGYGGVTALSNKAIIAENGSSAKVLLQTGSELPFYSTAKVLSLGELVQSYASGIGADRWATGFILKLDALDGTSAARDSGIYIYNMNGSAVGKREGNSALTADPANLGQFTGRVAMGVTDVVFSAATSGLAATNAVIERMGDTGVITPVARKGTLAPIASVPQAGDPLLSSFIGETMDGADRILYRATIAGAGVTAANNEAIFVQTAAGSSSMALRKGSNVGLPVGLSVLKILNFWGTSAVAQQTLALVQLSGVGVTPVNDVALLLVQEDKTLTLLMREGEAASDCAAATIGTISRVEVDPYRGYYAVLTTLAGASATSNQALFTGRTADGDTTTFVTHRRPRLLLRKGVQYDNQPSPIKSLSLPTTNITPSGAGATGRGRAISWDGQFVITVEFNNGVRQIMKGQL
jgi:FG-GAP repeat